MIEVVLDKIAAFREKKRYDKSLAERKEQERQLENAEKEYNAALRNTSAAILEEANSLYKRTDYSGAITKYTEIIERHPTFATAYVGRGDAYFELKQYDKASKDFQKAYDIEPKNAGAFFGKGKIFEYQGKRSEAVENYRLFIKYANIAKDNDKITAALDKIAKLEVTEDRITRITAGAIQVTDQKIERKVLDSGDVRIIAHITAEVDDLKISQILRNNENERFNLDEQYKNVREAIENDNKKLAELKHKIAELKTKQLPTNDLKVEVKAKEQEFLSNQKAEECIVLGQNRQYDKMLVTAEEAVKLNPKNDHAYFQRGIAYHHKKDYNNAIEDYNRVLVLNPNYSIVYNNRGVAYSHKGAYDKAIADYNQAIALNPNYSNAYYNRGYTYGRMRQYKMALNDLKKVLELNPNDKEAKKKYQAALRKIQNSSR